MCDNLKLEIIEKAKLESEQRSHSSENRYGYIYLTENLINHKLYIGQHKKGTFDPNYLGSGKGILEAVSRYGKSNFNVTLLVWCYSLDDINECEKSFISYFNAVRNRAFYNMAPGGLGSGSGEECVNFGKHMSEESKSKLKDSLESYFNSERYNKEVHSKKIKESLSNYYKSHSGHNKGKIFDDVFKEKVSNGLKEHFKTHEGHMKGKHHTEETKEKISKMSKGRASKHNKKVVCLETGEIFNSIDEASRLYGGHVRDVVKGRRKTSGGLHWRLLDET